MVVPILTTKLYRPAPRPHAVLRPRLTEQLSAGLRGKLTLVCAPAGFGKTTLVSGWLAGCESAAWLSLDEGDSELLRFLSHLVAALRTVEPSLGEEASALLRSAQPPSTRATLTLLLNDLATLSDPLTLVLDDYHMIDSREVDDALSFLLAHLSPQLHLVIATREDPQLPLARLRARGELNELRARDLRFTRGETADFFSQAWNLTLSEHDLITLEARTEGWIAGLQLAALSVQGRDDSSEFLASFAGNNRYVADYLVEEVLERQDEAVKRFLLETSILERLCGSLCYAVTGREDAQGLLETLERSNLFLVPLDDERRWYRYHHLFADLLKARLLAQRGRAAELHTRSSRWFEENGSPADAIRHAFAAGDTERAAALIELTWAQMDRSLQSVTWLGWFEGLPPDLVRRRPLLRLGHAWAILNGGELEAAERELDDLERWLGTLSDPLPGDVVVVDEAQFGGLPAALAQARAYLAQCRGDLAGAERHTRRMLELLSEDDTFGRGAGVSMLALTQWGQGDLANAYETFEGATPLLAQADDGFWEVVSPLFLADIRREQGRLGDAEALYTRALDLAKTRDDGPLPGVRELCAGLSEVRLERGDLAGARQLLQSAKALGERAVLPGNAHRWHLAAARLAEAEGDPAGAHKQLDLAEERYLRSPVPDARPVAARRAQLWLREGRLDKARAWARDLFARDSSSELTYVGEFTQFTLARLHLAEGDAKRALNLLARSLAAAEAGGRSLSVIEGSVLQARAQGAQGNSAAAHQSLQRALTLAVPEGYLQTFVSEGPTLAKLLSELAPANLTEAQSEHVNILLSAFETGEPRTQEVVVKRDLLIEPLSERELEVLRLVAQGHSNRDIAKKIYRALDTVKGHNRRIYGKLGVKSRTEAVAKARELDLL